jgi:hypothetical protein
MLYVIGIEINLVSVGIQYAVRDSANKLLNVQNIQSLQNYLFLKKISYTFLLKYMAAILRLITKTKKGKIHSCLDFRSRT